MGTPHLDVSTEDPSELHPQSRQTSSHFTRPPQSGQVVTSKYEEMPPLADRALRISPHPAAVRYERMIARAKMGDYEGAARDLIVARQIDPLERGLTIS